MKPLVLILLALLLTGVAASQTEKKTLEKRPSPEEIRRAKFLEETRNFIEKKKADPSIYWGEGIANIGEDLGAAKITAEERALRDLSQQIEVKIQSDITAVISGTSVSNGKKYTETVQNELVEKTKLYTNQVVTNVREKFFIDYPKLGTFTYIVWISRTEYEARVKKDLDDKKAGIRTAAQTADSEFQSGNFMAAVSNWINSKNFLRDFFGQLPLQDDFNKDGQLEEVNAYLNGKITNFFSKIKLSFLNDDVSYDVQGEVNQKPVIYAQYIEDEENKRAVPNLPLKVNFVHGEGHLTGEISSGNYGESSLPITWINPSNKTTTIRVDIDKNRIQGLNTFPLPQLPFITLTMKKVKTIALSVSFYNGEKTIEPEETKNAMNALLLNNGFSVVSIFMDGGEVNASGLENARRTNADYFLFIHVKTMSRGTVGGFENMYAANCRGLISLYKLPQGNLEFTENIPAVKGFGVSAGGATWDAYGKLKSTINQKSNSILQKIK